MKPKAPAGWKNRIIGTGQIDPQKLAANPKNWRTHPKAQEKALMGVLDEVGWVQNVIINKRTGFVLDGHLRVAAAITRAEATIPVLYVDLTPDEEAKMLAVLDPIGAMAGTDTDKLEELLKATEFSSPDTQRMLEVMARDNGIASSTPEPAPKADEDQAAEFQKTWKVKAGQVWVVPSKMIEGRSHRFMCGDSTDPKAVKRLMAKALAAMLFTDPPYGISYSGLHAKEHAPIHNDDKRRNDLSGFLTKAFKLAGANTKDTAAFYIWHASETREDFVYAMKAAGLVERQYLIWAKPSIVLGHADYQWSHEPCFYAHKQDQTPAFYGSRTQTTVWRLSLGADMDSAVVLGNGLLVSAGQDTSLYVTRRPPTGRKTRHVRIEDGQSLSILPSDTSTSLWELGRDTNVGGHPTQKPAGLAAIALQNSTETADIVLDLFLGSGSTAVAAEQLGRVCYGMDTEPKWIAVALQRMSEMGTTPRLEKP